MTITIARGFSSRFSARFGGGAVGVFVSTESVAVGFGAELYVTVTGDDGITPTGVVTVIGGDTPGGSLFTPLTGRLDKDGKVYFYADWASNQHQYVGEPLDYFGNFSVWYFTITYAGDATHTSVSGVVSVRVRPAN